VVWTDASSTRAACADVAGGAVWARPPGDGSTMMLRSKVTTIEEYTSRTGGIDSHAAIRTT